MYRILVVDDEYVERNGIKFLIEKYNINLDVVLMDNGKKALDFITHNMVDILLTDIKMPFMDGLELTKRALKINPLLKVIIFSAYGDFNYAKSAISLGVSDYLLKPINICEFKKVIHKVINDIDSRSKKEEEIINKYEDNSGYRKKHIVFSVLNMIPYEHYPKKDINFLNEYKRMVLIESNDFFENNGCQFEYELKRTISCDFDYFNINECQSVLFLKNCHQSDDEVYKLLKYFCVSVQNKFNKKIYMLISCKINDPKEITEKFSSFEQFLELQCFNKDTCVFCEWKNILDEYSGPCPVTDILNNIKYYIKMKDTFSLNKYIELLFRRSKCQGNISHLYIKYILSDTLKNIYESLSVFNSELFNNEIEKIYTCNNPEKILQIMKKNISMLDQNEIGRHDCSKEIETVKQYIYSNYNKCLSLNQLAQLVYLTPSYLSYSFKKKTGYNIKQFIKMYRMEVAKKLLQTTNLKISIISYKVGYTNESYFCQSFKEYWGESPEKFRQNLK